MASSTATSGNLSDAIEAPQTLPDDVIQGNVDYKDRPVKRSRYGRWKSASLIIGVNVAERFAFNGIRSNLISYLAGPLGQSTATAAETVNAWFGMAYLLPLLGGFVADSFLGRFRTVVLSSLLYILGLGFLALSTIFTTFKTPDQCQNAAKSCSPPSEFEVVFFFFALYLVAAAQGGYRPCAQAFGADQFDEQDPQECKAKSSFFNWWYFATNGSTTVSFFILTYIQDNISWGLGFGIPCLVMTLGLILFLLGIPTYRFRVTSEKMSPFVRIARVFLRAVRTRRITSLETSMEEAESQGLLPYQASQEFKILNMALLADPDYSQQGKNVCSTGEDEEPKAILRLFPIWTTCLVYGIVFAQLSTLFVKQGVTMDRSIGPSFELPAASLQAVGTLSIVAFIVIYDRILVPIARGITTRPSGITMLQRIGTGIFVSILSMVIAALVELKRLETAQEYGFIDKPEATIPMSVLWLIPQYFILGVSEALTVVGLQEFFYDQMPDQLKSVGAALNLTIFGVGSFLSGFLINVIDSATSKHGHESWFSDNLNKAHLDYFYWLLARLSAAGLIAFTYFAKSYVYN